jgi:hypothetical protein
MNEKVEDYLKTLVNISAKKSSKLLTFTSLESSFITRFPLPMVLDESVSYEAALVYFSTFNHRNRFIERQTSFGGKL